MKLLAIAVAALALSATVAFAFPESFGLPHFVQVDQWLGDADVDQEKTGSITQVPCKGVQATDRHCTYRDGRNAREQMPLK
ncbi:hypothetical protein IB238_15020 [Rhizobium sp. ARZ01]|uniref:hypothetical protein n=1 Tax=Rhizobium sp. ARZ01 TaxID=2769313 RepID=UPI00178600F5|nr:hypothetical protein [Rhizobium sp. ARZ01]MBD9373934.1 hypothetical protein [Rhizobium sp. ARZ01]